jgi:hypothetical protein
MRKQKINDKIATFVTTVTGNMWFFWAALLFILGLRITNPPKMADLLLNIENDLQLLLLAASAVVGGKQLSALMTLLKHIKKDVNEIEKDIDEIEKDVDSLEKK